MGKKLLDSLALWQEKSEEIIVAAAWPRHLLHEVHGVLWHEGEVVALLQLEQAAVDQLDGDGEGEQGVLFQLQVPQLEIALRRQASCDRAMDAVHLKS